MIWNIAGLLVCGYPASSLNRERYGMGTFMTTTVSAVGSAGPADFGRENRRYGSASRPVASPARSSNRVLLILVGILIGLAAMGAVTAILFSGSAMAGRSAQVSPEKAIPNYAALPAMSFSFADGRLIRRLKLKVMLEFDPTVETKIVDAHTPRIVGALNMRMAGLQPAELTGVSGTRMVKDAVTVAVNRELQPIRVRQVLVQEMLMN